VRPRARWCKTDPVIERRRAAALRVALVHLPTITAPRSLSYYGAIPPLGLAYLAGALLAASAEHLPLDLNVVDGTGEALDAYHPYSTGAGDVLIQGLTLAQIVARIDPAVDVIGVSLMFLHQWPLCRELLHLLREHAPRALIVAGGETPTAFWDEILKSCPALDLCVLGEGEVTFTGLLRALAAGAPTAALPGLAYRGPHRQPTRTPPAARISSQLLDRLPRPAWHLFPVAAYLARGHGSGVDRGRSMPVLTSRGCPYQCTFCSSPTMWGTRYVRRDPADVVDEIAELVERYAITNVDLSDLTAMLTKEWMLALADAIRARGLQITLQLPSGTRSEAVDAEAAAALYAAGVRNFCYAPESGSAETLRRIKKKVDLDALRASLRAAVAAGMTTHASLIIGLPGESPRDLLDTWRLALRLALDGCHTLAVIVFAPYPGSEEYQRLRAAGQIHLDDSYYYGSLLRSAGGLRSYNQHLGPRALFALQLAVLSSFFALAFARRPARITGLLGRLVRGRQESVLDLFLATKARQLRLLRDLAGP
jgi:anaerobic magnesium-protoporphyrin IX monomethyl ester cyclase